jgi:hypothetical protein
MIVDLLPAGLEIEIQILDNGFKLDYDITIDGKTRLIIFFINWLLAYNVPSSTGDVAKSFHSLRD